MVHNNNASNNNYDNIKLLLPKKQFYCQFSDFRSTIKLIKIQTRSQWMSNIVIIEIVVNNNNISNNNNNNNNTVDSW